MDKLLTLQPGEIVQVDAQHLIVGRKVVQVGDVMEFKLEFDNGAEIRAYIAPESRDVMATAPGVT